MPDDPDYIIRVKKDKPVKLFGFQLTGSRLRNKIFARVVFVSVVPLALAAATSLYITGLSHRYDVARIEDNVIQNTRKEIAKIIEETVSTFELFIGINTATGRPYTAIPELKREDVRFILEGILNDISYIETISIIDISNKAEFLKLIRGADGIVDSWKFNDVGGIEYFRKAAGGSNYVGHVYSTIRGPMMTVSVPVKNNEGTIIGVMAGEIKLEPIQDVVAQIRLGEDTGYVYVVEEFGQLVAHTERESSEFLSVGRIPLVAYVLSGKNSIGLGGQSRYTSFWGEEVIAAGSYMSEYGLAVIAEWPVKDANAFLHLVRNQMAGFVIAVTIATIIVSVFLANRIVKPIQELTRVSKRVAIGKFDETASVKTGDEIEDLAMSFNEMMKGLKQLEELREEFVFIAAHELRTPVTAIKGYIQMVLEGATGPLNDKTKEFLTKVVDANKRLVNLVNDLLEVARSEAGRLTVTTVPLEMVPIVRSVLSELKPLADEKSIQFVYNPDSSLPKTMADEGRLKEVLVNLIGNAIKYTIPSTGSTGSPQAGSLPGPEGPSGPRTAGQVVSGTVTIRHEVQGEKLTTHIQDTGVGISKEAQKKLFEKFYRVQTEQTQSITGTGLGLFIVKQIVEKMNGTIWVTSEEGRGSTFSFSLPLAP